MSICSIEDVAQAVGKPFWFQLYVMKDRGFIRSLIERAAAAKCSALVLTVDLQVLGQRHCDIRNGMTVPPVVKSPIIDIAKPGWALDPAGQHRSSNLAGHVRGMDNVTSLAQWTNSQFDPAELEGRRCAPAGQASGAGCRGRQGCRADSASALVVSNAAAARWSAVLDLGVAKDADAAGSQIEVMFDGVSVGWTCCAPWRSASPA
jgi:L-lactate dehydrogenase (cytochrome)